MGKVLTDRREIDLLRETPWREVEIYTPNTEVVQFDLPHNNDGRVKAGPANEGGYIVSPFAKDLKRELYVLRLDGNTDAYLGKDSSGRSIFKIGLSISPELRCRDFQKSIPEGAFKWCVYRTTTKSGFKHCESFDSAVAGEDAMKKHLAKNAKWLGGEFYLATESEIDKAWHLGHDAVKSCTQGAN